MVRDGQFGPDEAIRCCHDCLSALSTAASAGIRHGDIRPENVICATAGLRQPHLVLLGWGLAILEDRDRSPCNESSFLINLCAPGRKLKLGDISAVVKAFADYVDSLCGTPYPMDYEIWLRSKKHIHEEDHGKEIGTSG
ncbi:hypothetical protein POM88_012679 [Heracleum sosnowskyi]|uniref:Protein kinase domain-containing protein n=1 Tax=Heracleum sosnowskyi TaxID=360622 RepID=A0AAD8IYJ7_9APIA|nr:hypothetical protein POM88_012679 [Heracleum sosnowskyi]